ncbi:MAG TPA: sulfide/dihydroorotate dehydrogenase-like FAD/NAD-binding protein, partial [Phycisphaerae bacterium]|nr:sulfide/dihydroorotate dehydrogenase-like FAD/NAD-binding protein [Phycisphaerae bacterium]
FPMARALAEAGNEVTAIVGGRSKDYVLLVDELSAFCSEVRTCTDDGTLGTHGFVTQVLADVLADESTRPGAVFAVGPIGMMAAVADMTRPDGIETIVSLNPIMVDGTGMCGGCRVTVDGVTKFACVDGPEFDAHKVDFKELAQRLKTYDEHECRLGRPGLADEKDDA